MYAQYPQKKTKGGIIALIIVLCSLLTIGFIGMMVYGFSVGIKEDSNSGRSDSGNSFRLPNKDSTTPFETLPDTSSQGKTHDESDYSDKVNKDYSGMKLESNPKDAKTNNSYTSAKASEKVSDSVVAFSVTRTMYPIRLTQQPHLHREAELSSHRTAMLSQTLM